MTVQRVCSKSRVSWWVLARKTTSNWPRRGPVLC